MADIYGKIRIFLVILIFCIGGVVASVKMEAHSDAAPVCFNELIIVKSIDEIQKECEYSSVPAEVVSEEIPNDNVGANLPREDIELIALVTMAEAEGESEYGKRLVIDTILNRMDSSHYPDTASEVIYQPNQFSSMWNGRVDKCYVMDEICLLVEEELLERKNYEVIFFTAGNYSKYGTSMFQEGNHYFSSYE